MIKIIALGRLKEPYFRSGFLEYKKRLQRFVRLEMKELKEEKDVLKNLKEKDVVVVLDEKGENLTSISFAEFIKRNHLEHDIVFVVGGPDGHSKQVLDKADLLLSLSNLTFPNQLARILLIEQIYRAFTIIKGVGYHR